MEAWQCARSPKFSPLVYPLVMQAVVSGQWAMQCSWHVTKAQGGPLFEDCLGAYMAAPRFPPFLWSKVKHCSPIHHAHNIGSRAKYCGISGHVSVV